MERRCFLQSLIANGVALVALVVMIVTAMVVIALKGGLLQ